MGTLFVGSTALAVRLPGIREPKDIDTFSNVTVSGPGYDNFWHPTFEGWVKGTRIATLDELYTIKVSHSYWSLKNGSWDKHMYDVVTLRNAGAMLDLDLHDLLYKVWEETHGPKRVNLNMDKSEFFDDAVKRVYDHDSIHRSVAYYDKPIYEGVLSKNQEIAMDMAAIRMLDFDMKVKLYREEIYATALERWVLPSNYTISPRLAYARAVQKTITSLTKGWSARFLVENYDIFRNPDMDYVGHHKSKAHHLIRLDNND